MRNVVTTLAVLFMVSVAYTLFYRHNRDEWEARVEQTLQDAAAWEAQAAAFKQLAEEAEARAVDLDAAVTEYRTGARGAGKGGRGAGS
jgi:hypothetical protein